MRNLTLLCFLALGLTVTAQLQHQLHGHISNMIGADIEAGHLINVVADWGTFVPLNSNFDSLDAHMSHMTSVPHIWWEVGTFHRFTPLYYGTNTKVYSLTFYNHINSEGSGFVLAQASIGFRSDDSVQVGTAFGLVMISAKPQFTQVNYRSCNRFLFFSSCHDAVRNEPRGTFTHELDAIIRATERRAALNMRNSLGLGQVEQGFALSNGFQDELSKLQQLYTEIEYEYFDVQSADLGNWNDVIYKSMKGHGDQDARNRIYQFLVAHGRSNFIWAVSDSILFYMIVQNNGNGTFNLHVSEFVLAKGGRLPVGAFATSVGGWSLERGGEGASPSIHQILAVFNFK
jgi:hypothetical protein